MRNIGILGLAVVIAGIATVRPAAAQSDEVTETLSLGNRTCGALTLTLESDAPCDVFSTGCRIPLDADQVSDVDMKQPSSLQFLDLKIEGTCPGQPATTISGRCAMDLDRMFSYRVWSSPGGWPAPSADPLYDATFTELTYDSDEIPYDTNVVPDASAIDIALSDCQTSADGVVRVCTVSCQSHGE